MTERNLPHNQVPLEQIAQSSETLDVSTLTPQEIIERGLEIERIEDIDPGLIDFEEGIVDYSHADKLNKSMKKKRGQLSPIVVRARVEDGQLRYDVADGFHRAWGAKAAEDPTIRANVMYGCDDEELQDIRILSVSSVKSVQYPRIARWMDQAFSQTKWASKMRVAQAFAITVNDSSRARGIDISEDELAELKDWVNKRCQAWGDKPVASAYQILRTVDMADPELVRQVRNSSGGKDRIAVITPDRLKHVVEAYPDAPNFEVQRIILDEVCARRLSATETKLFVMALKKSFKPWMSSEQLQELLPKIDITTLLEEQKESRITRPRHYPDFHQSQPSGTQSETAAQENARTTTRRSRRSSDFYNSPTTNNHAPSSSTESTLRLAAERIEQLRQQVRNGEEELRKSQELLSEATWWRDSSIPLTGVERTVFEQVIFDRAPLSFVAEKLNIPTKEIGAHIASVIQKSRVKK